jgi:hypothetical protein
MRDEHQSENPPTVKIDCSSFDMSILADSAPAFIANLLAHANDLETIYDFEELEAVFSTVAFSGNAVKFVMEDLEPTVIVYQAHGAGAAIAWCFDYNELVLAHLMLGTMDSEAPQSAVTDLESVFGRVVLPARGIPSLPRWFTFHVTENDGSVGCAYLAGLFLSAAFCNVYEK